MPRQASRAVAGAGLCALSLVACTDLLGATDIVAADAGADASGVRVTQSRDSGRDARRGSSSSGRSSGATSTSSASSTASSIVVPGTDASVPPSSCGAVDRCQVDGGPGCCRSPEIAGGTYDRLSSSTGWSYPATVSGLRLDMYLVTVSRFRLFVTAWSGGYEPPPGSGRHSHLDADAGLLAAGDSGASHETGWLSAYDGLLTPTSANLACDTASATWTEQPGPHDSLPINCASWYEAYAFCVWDGGFLPSEAEWEYAAVAGSQQRTYPWGTAAPGAGVDYAVFGCLYDGAGTCTGIQNIAPVGSCDAGAGLWGQLDLAGEAWEWTLDVYSETYALPCTDCAYLGPATARVIRGGGFDTSASRIGAAVRDSSDPKGRAKDVGVRCARVP